VITDVERNGDILFITGSGFGDDPPEGAEEYLNVEVDGVAADISSWTDTEIVASTSSGSGEMMVFASSSGGTVTVNSLFCSASFEGSSACQECNSNCNGDDVVDLDDLIIMIGEFPRIDCDINSCQADFNADGRVDLFDLLILIVEYPVGNCCP